MEKEEIKKSSGKHHISNYCRQAPLMDAKISGQNFTEKQVICKASKYLPPRYLLTTKGKTVEKASRNHLNQMIMVNITNKTY